MTYLIQAAGQMRQEGIIETTTDTLVVGAGQAGVAMSEHLSTHGVPHLVLESKRIAEAWRTCRWDSLVANGPAWHDRFPGLEFAGKRFHNGYSICNDFPSGDRPNIFIDSYRFFASLCYGT